MGRVDWVVNAMWSCRVAPFGASCAQFEGGEEGGCHGEDSGYSDRRQQILGLHLFLLPKCDWPLADPSLRQMTQEVDVAEDDVGHHPW